MSSNSSSDDEDYRSPRSGGGNRAWKDFIREEDEQDSRGGRSLLDDDPFGDRAQVNKPRAHVWYDYAYVVGGLS